MANMFEKTMALCLENKKDNSATIAGKKRTLTEKKRMLKEQEDLVDDELGLGEAELDPFDAEMNEIDGEDTDIEMGDIEDDIVVVIDPEVTEDEIDDMAATAQELVDAADGMAVTDEYVDDFTYTCPICGNTFISGVEMHDGEECPVCGEFPTGYVLVGQISTADEEPAEDEAPAEEAPVEDVELPEEDGMEDLDLDLDDVPVEDEVEERFNRSRARNARNEQIRRRPTQRPSKRVENKTRNVRKANRGLQLDESTFNPHLTKFVRENYKNARSLRVTNATLNKNRLTIECKLTMKSGASKKVNFVCEGFKPNKTMILKARDTGAFKCESSKTAPFTFRCSMNGRTIRCEGMRYNFVTKSMKEGKRVQVYGKYMTENRKPAQRPQSRTNRPARARVENRNRAVRPNRAR